MSEKNFRILTIILLFLALILSIISFLKLENIQNDERRIEYGSLSVASALAEKKLYTEAINEYNKYIGRAEIRVTERKNALLSLGDLQLKEAKNYRGAMETYTRILALYPDIHIKDDINKKIAECLAKLGRSTEADRMIDKVVAGKTAEASLNKKVARIGEKFITYNEFIKMSENLPQMMKIPMDDKKGKINMLYQVLQQMIVEKEAKSLDLRNKKSFITQLSSMEKLMLRQYLLNEFVFSKLEIDDQAVKYYYEANKDKFRDPSKYAVKIYFASDSTKAVELIHHLKTGDGMESYSTLKTEIIDNPITAMEISKKIKLNFDLTELLKKGEKGQLAGPFETIDKLQAVIKINKVNLSLLHPLKEVKHIVKSKLTEEKQQTKLMEYFQNKFKEFDIKVYNEAFDN